MLEENIPMKPSVLTDTESAIIRSLLYFEIFNHPLTQQEILKFSSIKNNSLEEALTALVAQNIIIKKSPFYFIQLSDKHIERRLQAEILFQKKLKTAKRYSTIIASCPFVRAVCLSGTMSKEIMHPDSDIDYFIITSPNRVWVAKLFLLVFKKVVLLNSHKNFCINYFIATDHLHIEEQNSFTATELATVLPVYGYQIYQKLLAVNDWVYSFYPNFIPRTQTHLIQRTNFPIKKGIEVLLTNRVGDWLNNWFKEVSWRKYNQQYGHQYQPDEMELMFKSKSYVSKGHDKNYQQIVTDKIAKKVTQFEHTYKLKLA